MHGDLGGFRGVRLRWIGMLLLPLPFACCVAFFCLVQLFRQQQVHPRTLHRVGVQASLGGECYGTQGGDKGA